MARERGKLTGENYLMLEASSTENIVWETLAGEGNPATIDLRSFTLEERVVRAAKSLGKFWLMATFSILIPALHIFLVPTFLLIGLVQAFRKLRFKEVALNSSGTCPNCQANVTINFGEIKWLLPRYELCPNCDKQIRLVHKEA